MTIRKMRMKTRSMIMLMTMTTTQWWFEVAFVQGLVVIAKRQHFLDYRNIWLLYRVLNKSLFHEYEWITIDEYEWITIYQILLRHLRAIQLLLRGLWRGGSMAGNHGHASIVCTQCFTLASIARPGRELRGMLRGAYTHLDSHQWHM